MDFYLTTSASTFPRIKITWKLITIPLTRKPQIDRDTTSSPCVFQVVVSLSIRSVLTNYCHYLHWPRTFNIISLPSYQPTSFLCGDITPRTRSSPGFSKSNHSIIISQARHHTAVQIFCTLVGWDFSH